jgi:hypothetical protein
VLPIDGWLLVHSYVSKEIASYFAKSVSAVFFDAYLYFLKWLMMVMQMAATKIAKPTATSAQLIVIKISCIASSCLDFS